MNIPLNSHTVHVYELCNYADMHNLQAMQIILNISLFHKNNNIVWNATNFSTDFANIIKQLF